MKMMKQSSEKATQAWVLALTSVASFMVGLDALVHRGSNPYVVE